jgi:cysteinyl-tRNA synthetase
VMSTCCLGESFDIHGGGSDLEFPHHENEIAQSEAATGKQYANAWMHCGMIRINGEKMSKSLNNFFTIRDVLEKYHPEVVRYLLVASHYRSAINYSEDSLRDAKGALERFYHALRGLPRVAAKGGEEFVERFSVAMNDDFGTPEACAVLFDLVREINRLRDSDVEAAAGLAGRLRELGDVLGVLQLEADDFLRAGAEGKVDAAEVEGLIQARLQARADKNWAESDRIRDQLTAMGVVLEDSKGGTTWRLAD